MRLTYRKCTPFCHKMLRIALASGSPLQTPLGELTTLLRPPSREGLLAFSNCSFASSALALSPIFSISGPPKVIYRFTPLTISQAIDTLHSWMLSNRLRLNPSKTQYIWFGTHQQHAKTHLGSLASKYQHFTFSSQLYIRMYAWNEAYNNVSMRVVAHWLSRWLSIGGSWVRLSL